MEPIVPMSILVVDDEPFICKLAEKELALPGRKVTTASTGEQALKLTARREFDVIVLDVRLPDTTGIALLQRFRASIPDVEVVMITGYSEVASAVEAMKLGAFDYITKPFSLDEINLTIGRAFQRKLLQQELRTLRVSNTGKPRENLIGQSMAIRKIEYLINKVAPTNAPVLLTGESGVGKNVVVNQLHAKSSRADKPLIIKNCGAFNQELLRSELFGHRKGSFTGAQHDNEGLLALANNGSLFFDEVGELSLEVQSMLLRVLEFKSYRRVGDKDERKVDVRFFFATNRDLAEEVAAGRFHEALYHRINVFCIEVPPLRERREDIPDLLDFFLEHLYPDRPPYRLTSRAYQCMLAYRWPGNIRELKNVVERGIILAENDLITTNSLPEDITKCLDDPVSGGPFPTLDQHEKKFILRVLEHADYNRTNATLYRKLKAYGLDESVFEKDGEHG
jgi:two-component system NtrC family response regulator